MDENGPLFSNVKFVLAQCNNAEQVKNILIEGGAKHINYLSESVTHVIADANCPEAEEAVDLYDKPVVTSRWVHLSQRTGLLLPPEAFSPLRDTFRDVVASFESDLSQTDIDKLAAIITYHGGRLSKDPKASTHLIVASPKTTPSNLPENQNLEIVAPDWILDSVRQLSRCDESHYNPQYLLSPPPPTPSPAKLIAPTPPLKIEPQAADTTIESSTMDQKSNSAIVSANSTSTSIAQIISPNKQHPRHQQPQQQTTQAQQLQQMNSGQNMQMMPPSQIPRIRGPQGVIRSAQPQFRPQLPPNYHMNTIQRHPVQQQQQQHQQQQLQQQQQQQLQQQQQQQQGQRLIGPETQQMKKPNLNYNAYRKPNPYQSNQDVQQQVHLGQPQHIQVSQPQATQGPFPGNQMNNPSRIPQPNAFHPPNQLPYQAGHMQQRAMAPNQPVMNQSTQQHPNRLQNPPGQAPLQRPYQICVQQQPTHQVNINYQTPQQSNIHRQQVYYAQDNSVPMPMRMPQQGPIMRSTMHIEPTAHDNFTRPQHQTQEMMQPHMQRQQQYRPQPGQQVYQQPPHNTVVQNQPSIQSFQAHRHPQTEGGMQTSPVMRHPRAQFQPNTAGPSIRPPRHAMIGNQDVRMNNRNSNATQLILKQSKSSRMPLSQPHPSIFDHVQETSLAQMKARVPVFDENVQYVEYKSKQKMPQDQPFIGCKFKFIEHEDIHSKTKQKWLNVIKMAGGTFVEELGDATHMICETRTSDFYRTALEKGIRCVSIYWADDVIAQDDLTYPWRALHIPLNFTRDNAPLKDQIISMTNFHGRERRLVKEMIIKSGAKFTDYFSQSNTILICGNPGGDKYERAIEWKTPIVNCQFLSDCILQHEAKIETMLAQTKYHIFNRGDPLKLTSYALIRDHMKPWLEPIVISDEQIESNNKQQPSLANGNEQSNDNQKVETQAIEEEEEESPAKEVPRTSAEPIRLLFTRLEPKLAAELKKCANNLELQYASSPIECTHLVVDRISRTPKFICAFNHAKYILSYKWLVESNRCGKLLDEKQFILKDTKGEESFSFNLVYSLLKRKRRSGLLFNDIIFFVTPSVMTSVTNLKEMIESAGGVVITRKLPTKAQIEQMRVDGKNFIVVTNRQDLYLCSAIEPLGIDIVTVEFVISGILRQDIDIEAHRLKGNGACDAINQQESSSTGPTDVSATKRMRLD